MKYHLGLTISILFLIACTEEQPVTRKEPSVKEIEAQKKADEEVQKKQEQAAVIAAYLATNPLENNDLWDNWRIQEVITMEGANLYNYFEFWKDSLKLKDEKQILKLNAKKAVISNYKDDYHDAFFVKKLTGQKVSLPNIHLDTLDSKLDIKNLVMNFKRDLLDKIEDYAAKQDFVKRNLMTEELLKKVKPFFSLWNTSWRTYNFPLIYRDERTFSHIWNQVKPTVFKEITKQQFEKLSGGFYVNTLLSTYKLAELHKKCRDTIAFRQELPSDTFNASECELRGLNYSSLMTKEYREQFKSKGENQEKELGGYLCCLRTWFLSFWFRRHIEGTDKITHQILLEIKEHYK